MNNVYYKLEISEDDPSVAYVHICYKGEKERRKVARSICLSDIHENVKGPTIVVDLAADGRILGIELIG